VGGPWAVPTGHRGLSCGRAGSPGATASLAAGGAGAQSSDSLGRVPGRAYNPAIVAIARHRARIAALLAALVVIVGAWAEAAPAKPPSTPRSESARGIRIKPWIPDTGSAIQYALSRTGVIAFAVRTRSHYWGWYDTRIYPSASVLKPMLMVAYLRRPDVRDRDLTADERGTIEPMIRWSDNNAADRMFNMVGEQGLDQLALDAHMEHFSPSYPIWGNSQIDAQDQTEFFLYIDKLIPPRHRAYAMNLLETIVPWQRWGVGQVQPPGWRLFFKGGWGSGTGRVDHQVALLTHGHTRVSVAVLTMDDGSHPYGQETLQGMFARLLAGLPEHGPMALGSSY